MRKKKLSLWQSITRLLKHKLIVPMIRSPHPPEYKALGVAVGFAWAMTPLVGIQMWLVFMTWVIVAKIWAKGFSLPLALAWTWVSNVVTLVPIYYVFYVTGQLMRGNFGNISGYGSLKETIANTFFADYTFLQKWGMFFKLILQDWGVSMAIGCLPWAVAAFISGYYFTMKFEQMRLARRAQKQRS